MNIALAGAGQIGRRHGRLLSELHKRTGRARLCAVVDPTELAKTYAAEQGVPYFGSLEALFADGTADMKPDGVILATPNPLHVPGALVCAAHGVSALIEKPVADKLDEGQRLARAVAACGVPMLVGHHRRHSATLQAASRLLKSGQLGRLVSVMGSAQFCKPDSYFDSALWRKQSGGGPILINLIHEMDNLRFLCGEVVAVQAMASNAVRGFAVEDTAVINLRFASGVLGTFTLSDTAASPRSWEQTSGEDLAYPRYENEDCYFIVGTQGSLAVPTMRSWRYPDGDSAARSWWKPFEVARQTPDAPDKVDPLAAQLLHFCDVIERKAKPLVSVEDALRSLAVVDAVRVSVASGRVVML